MSQLDLHLCHDGFNIKLGLANVVLRFCSFGDSSPIADIAAYDKDIQNMSNKVELHIQVSIIPIIVPKYLALVS